MSVLVEIVACTAEDAVRAEAAGADRIELVSAISEGGLTPSVGTLLETKARCRLPVMAMIRPRGGDFDYSDSEFSTMLRDVEALVAAGADGLVVGTLSGDRLDEPRLREVILRAQGRPVAFHRAFDLLRYPLAMIDRLADLGVRRILSAGGRERAAQAHALAEYRESANGRIEILAGGGIRAETAPKLLRKSGVDQIHAGPFRLVPANLPANAPGREFVQHLSLDEDQVRKLVDAIRGAGVPPADP